MHRWMRFETQRTSAGRKKRKEEESQRSSKLDASKERREERKLALTEIPHDPQEPDSPRDEMPSTLPTSSHPHLVSTRDALADVRQDRNPEAHSRSSTDDQHRRMISPPHSRRRSIRSIDQRSEENRFRRRELLRRRREVVRLRTIRRRSWSCGCRVRLVVDHLRLRTLVHPPLGFLPKIHREPLSRLDEKHDLLLDVLIVDADDGERMGRPDRDLPDLKEDVLTWCPAEGFGESEGETKHPRG